jgi:DNA-binding LacI/PurR family transcriptional regulator/DNA-binding transcriptional regulator YhcF (GntR family)
VVRAPVWQSLADRLEADIRAGRIEAGERLPKVRYLTATHRVSDRTVLKAYRELIRRGWAHRERRATYAGSAPPSASMTLREPYVVAIIQKGTDSWRGLYRSDRTMPFCAAFSAEAGRRAIRLMPVVRSSRGRGVAYPRGISGLSTLMDSQGHRLLGVLVTVSDEVDKWITTVCSRRLRCVWLDRTGDGEMDGPRPSPHLFTRCHPDERGAVRAALAHLHSLGHRTVGFPFLEDKPWIRRRLTLMQEEAGRFAPPMHVRHADDTILTPDARQEAIGALAALTNVSLAVAAKRLRQAEEMLRRRLVTILPYILSDPVTAIVAPNDTAATYLFDTLVYLGIHVPKTMTLLSFDNSLRVQSTPISSVDFGFDHLGYAAFHALIGDIPLNRDRHGNLAGPARVAERGSTGPARSLPTG